MSLTGAALRPAHQGILGFGPVGAALAGTGSYPTTAATTEFAFHMCPDEGTMWFSVKMVDTLQAMASAPVVTPFAATGFLEQLLSKDYWMVNVGEMSLGTASTSIAMGSASSARR